MTALFITIIIILLSLIIGSFLNVCIYRLPLQKGVDDQPPQDISVSKPARSFCPKCKKTLLWWHNIPVVSWMMLRGRCYYCKENIPWRYPLVELLSVFFALLSFQQHGPTLTALLIYLFSIALVVISFIDLDYYIIPNEISLPGTALGVVVAIINQFFPIFAPPVVSGIMDAFWGLLVGAGSLYFISEVYLKLRKQEGLGMGDVKLLAMCGAFFGPMASFYTIFVGSLIGSLFAVVGMIFMGRSSTSRIPFGPYLSAATLMYLYSGQLVLDWWFSFMRGAL